MRIKSSIPPETERISSVDEQNPSRMNPAAGVLCFCQSYHTEAAGATRGATLDRRNQKITWPQVCRREAALSADQPTLSFFSFMKKLSCFYHRDLFFFFFNKNSILLISSSRECEACEQATKEGRLWPTASPLAELWVNFYINVFVRLGFCQWAASVDCKSSGL